MAAAVWLVCLSASANTLYLFTTSGLVNGKPVAASALFDVSESGLTIALTNTTSSPGDIAQILDGFRWTMEGDPTLAAISQVLSGFVADCAGATDPCPGGSAPTAPNSWWLIGEANGPYEVLSGAPYVSRSDTYRHQLHPYGLLSAGYDAPGGNGGLSNGQHNPLLVGTMTLTYDYPTLTYVPEITSATFLWGTEPGTTPGDCETCAPPPPQRPELPVPEPAGVLLLTTGVLGSAGLLRKRQK
jgi:hypothetical protein